MDAGSAFKVAGPTLAVLGSFAVSPPGTLINLPGDWSLLATNRSATNDAYLAYGATSAAVTSAIVPIVGTPSAGTQNVIPLPHGTTQTFSFSGPTFIGVIVPTANATIDITPGVIGSV